MRKFLIGLSVAVIVGLGGYYGVFYLAQQTAAREVDALLDSWRASAGTATRGRVEFDLWTRTLKIADIVVHTQTTPPAKMTMAQVVASGIDSTGKASRIEITDWEASDVLPGRVATRFTQRAPRITIEGYSGRPPAPRKVSSALDLMRLWLEQFSAITASSIHIPELVVSVTPPGADGQRGAPTPIDYKYSNMVLRDVRNGRVAEVTVDGLALRGGVTGHPFGAITGEVGKVSIVDADVGPLLTLLDATRTKDGGYQRVYRQISVGPYSLHLEDGSSISIDGFTAEDIGLKPSKLSMDDMLFLADVATPAGGIPTQAQMSMLIDKVAGLYEGMYIGKLDMRGLSFNMRREGFKIASMRINGLENGRLADFSMERLDGQTALGDPLSIGRITLKGFDIANLLRTAAQLGAQGQQPTPEQIVGMLALLEGFEFKDFAVPDPKTGRVLHLETLAASWGQFVGVFPSKARISIKVAGPISSVDPEPLRTLADRGILTLAAGLDVGATWTEGAQAFTLAPAAMQVSDILSVSAKASVGNVPRDIFSIDPAKVMGAASLVQAGPIEISLRDLGGLDLAFAQLAKAEGRPPEAGRAMLLDALARSADALSQTNPDVRPVFQAIGRFVQSKGQTLTIRLTPKGRIGVLQLVEAGRGYDPMAALFAAFNIEAEVGR